MADQKFTLYWRDGKRQVVEGRTVAEAMTLAGYGGGAVAALDFHAKGDDTGWEWSAEERKWVVTPDNPHYELLKPRQPTP